VIYGVFVLAFCSVFKVPGDALTPKRPGGALNN